MFFVLFVSSDPCDMIVLFALRRRGISNGFIDFPIVANATESMVTLSFTASNLVGTAWILILSAGDVGLALSDCSKTLSFWRRKDPTHLDKDCSAMFSHRDSQVQPRLLLS